MQPPYEANAARHMDSMKFNADLFSLMCLKKKKKKAVCCRESRQHTYKPNGNNDLCVKVTSLCLWRFYVEYDVGWQTERCGLLNGGREDGREKRGTEWEK